MSFHFKCLQATLFCLSLIATVQAETENSANQPQLVNIEVTTHLGDAQTFVEGDQISFMLSLDKAAYVYLFYEDADSQIVQLVPNRQQVSNYYQPGLFMPVPDQDADFKFIVQAPFGTDRLWAFALDRKVEKFSGQQLDNGLLLLDQNISEVTNKMEGQALKHYGSSYLTLITEVQ